MAAHLVISTRKTPTKFDDGYNPSFERDGTPCCLSWSTDDVADWVEYLGFKQYRVSIFYLLQSSHHDMRLGMFHTYLIKPVTEM